MLGAVQPILVMVLIWAVDGQRPAILTLGAAIGGVVGMALMLGSPEMQADPLGVAAALAGAASMATGIWLTRRWPLGIPIAALTGWQLLLGGTLLMPAALTLEPALPGLTTLQAAGYAWLCLAGALLAYLLWFHGIARLPSTTVSALALLSLVTAATLGWVILGQAMRPPALFGMVLVLTSIALVQRSAARHEPPSPSRHQTGEKS